MSRTSRLLVSAALGTLLGCTVPSSTDPTVTNLTTIANAATADLNNGIAVANAATPPAPHLASCYTSILAVNTAMAKVLAATPAGSTVGVFTAAAVASLYQPGSAQFNWTVETIETGCIAEWHDLNQAAASMAGMPAALVAALAIAAPIK